MAEDIQQYNLLHRFPLSSSFSSTSSSSSDDDDDNVVVEARCGCSSPYLMLKEHDYILGLAQNNADGEDPTKGYGLQQNLGEAQMESEDTDLKLGLASSRNRVQCTKQCKREKSSGLMGESGSRAELSSKAMELSSPATRRGNGDNATRNRVQIGDLPKSRVIGWPPVRPSRRTSLSMHMDTTFDCFGSMHPPFFVKVNMDGVPIGRKINLRAHNSYEGLLTALREMFHGSNVGPNAYLFKFQLTYEDRDGDWMLVGDVPWEMFVKTVKRLRIMREQSS